MDGAKTKAILEAMQEGNSLRKACKTAKVPIGTFLGWVDADDALAEQYARSRTRMLDVQAEQLEEIGEEAALAKDAVKVAGLRLQSDNRKWLLSKLAPKKYGERLDLNHGGNLTITRQNLTDAELEAIAAGGSAGAAGATKGEG